MIYYCISDIHGCLSAFNDGLKLIIGHLGKPDTALILLGDYVHGGEDNYGVLDKIISLQRRYGRDKVIALMGNHEEMVIKGRYPIDDYDCFNDLNDKYISWMSDLPYYHTDGATVFVHAGIDEEAGEYWEYGSEYGVADYTFTQKYPAQTGRFCSSYKIVAGHIHTSEISGDPRFNGIFYDGESHYYIDADTLRSGFVNILKVDTERQKYYEITPYGETPVLPFNY